VLEGVAAAPGEQGRFITPAVDGLMFAVVGETIPEWAGVVMLGS